MIYQTCKIKFNNCNIPDSYYAKKYMTAKKRVILRAHLLEYNSNGSLTFQSSDDVQQHVLLQLSKKQD